MAEGVAVEGMLLGRLVVGERGGGMTWLGAQRAPAEISPQGRSLRLCDPVEVSCRKESVVARLVVVFVVIDFRRPRMLSFGG